jgi:hypothetical protein
MCNVEDMLVSRFHLFHNLVMGGLHDAVDHFYSGWSNTTPTPTLHELKFNFLKILHHTKIFK